jgi:hypothetical protein
MQKLTTFFWLCSGANIATLRQCPTEQSKYAGIGATIFFTGLMAALAGGYALYTVFDNLWASLLFGLIWGLLIFNLDRFIVSSMRKERKAAREWLMAVPRLVLAILISVVIAKPLELKIFEKEINTELTIMQQQQRARQEEEVKARFAAQQDSLKKQITLRQEEIKTKTVHRDELLRLAREEADGTGGSRKKNLGPIYKVKKENAETAERELQHLLAQAEKEIEGWKRKIQKTDSVIAAEIAAIEHIKLNGPAARLEAMSRLTQQHTAMAWAEWFIILLFIALETSPVVVKLMSPKGPYDNLLKVVEHKQEAFEVEEVAKTNAEVKERTAALPETERSYIQEKLDSALG